MYATYYTKIIQKLLTKQLTKETTKQSRVKILLRRSLVITIQYVTYLSSWLFFVFLIPVIMILHKVPPRTMFMFKYHYIE